MLYAGIDPSITNTGVVLLNEYGELQACANSGEHDNKKLDPIRRYMATTEALCLVFPSGENFTVGYEDYSFASAHRAFSLAEFGGILKKELYDSGAEKIRLFAPMWNKKFATGNGTADKKMMMNQAVKECPGLSGETSDVCDAYFLAKAVWYADAPEDVVIANETNRALLRLRLEMVRAWQIKAKELHRMGIAAKLPS